MQIGITLVGIMVGSFGGAAIARDLALVLALMGRRPASFVGPKRRWSRVFRIDRVK